MNEANETYRAASAIAAFDAIQVAFAALVKKGILSKAEAEQILMQAIETIKTGGAGDQAPKLLAIALEKISKFEPAPRQSGDRGRLVITRSSGHGAAVLPSSVMNSRRRRAAALTIR